MDTPARGFAQLTLIVIVVLFVAAAGATYYGAVSVPSSLNQVSSDTSTPPAATSTAETSAPTDKPAPTTPVATCAGRDPMKPYILSISPTSGPAGTKVTIKGCNLSGFEGDVGVTFERSDGKKIGVAVGTLMRKIIDVAEEQTITGTIQTECPTGTEIGAYSGLETKCDTVVPTPGVYTVYTITPSGKSNTVTFTVTSGAATNKPPTIQSFTGPSSLKVGVMGTWSVKATDPEQDKITYVVTWGDETPLDPKYVDVTHPLNRASLGYGQTFTATTAMHAYSEPGVYTIKLLAFDQNAGNSSGQKTLTITVTN